MEREAGYKTVQRAWPKLWVEGTLFVYRMACGDRHSADSGVSEDWGYDRAASISFHPEQASVLPVTVRTSWNVPLLGHLVAGGE